MRQIERKKEHKDRLRLDAADASAARTVAEAAAAAEPAAAAAAVTPGDADKGGASTEEGVREPGEVVEGVAEREAKGRGKQSGVGEPGSADPISMPQDDPALGKVKGGAAAVEPPKSSEGGAAVAQPAAGEGSAADGVDGQRGGVGPGSEGGSSEGGGAAAEGGATGKGDAAGAESGVLEDPPKGAGDAGDAKVGAAKEGAASAGGEEPAVGGEGAAVVPAFDSTTGVRSALWKELKMMGMEQYEKPLHDLGVRPCPYHSRTLEPPPPKKTR